MESLTERYKSELAKEEDKLRTFKISYFYLATGMEGRPDIFPEKIIQAPSRSLATYIYWVTFFDSFHTMSFKEYSKRPIYEQEWGMKIEEVKKGNNSAPR